MFYHPVFFCLVYVDIQLAFADIDTDIAATGVTVSFGNCVHNSPLLHSSSRLFRLFELGYRIGTAPRLVNGLATRRQASNGLPYRKPAATGLGLTLSPNEKQGNHGFSIIQGQALRRIFRCACGSTKNTRVLAALEIR